MAIKRGIVMFAHNNEEIDYLKIAVVNSLLAQKHLGLKPLNVTIVTDPHSYEYGIKTLGEKLLKRATRDIVIVEKDVKFKMANMRVYKDTSHTPKTLPFYNINRCDAFDISPYDETILLDADYLVLSNTLNQCWQHNNSFMMNWNFKDVMASREFDALDRISDLGITMYWATVVYFRKNEETQSFFNIVKHVRDNREYYKDLYKWRGNLYRNDFSFSIAAHMMSGYTDKKLPQLPFTLYKTFDNDDVYKADGDNNLLLYLEKPHSPGDFIMNRWEGVDIHVMNKWALGRIADTMLEYLE